MFPEYRKALSGLMRCQPVRFSDPALYRKLPPNGGLYLIRRNRATAGLLYIGKASSIQSRLYRNLLHGQLRTHTLSRKCLGLLGLQSKQQVKEFLKRECTAQWICVDDKKSRSFIEHFLIAHLRTPLND